LLEQPHDDIAIIVEVLAALEHHADPAALPALQRLFHSDLIAARQAYWQSLAASMATLPISNWSLSELPAPARRQIEQALSTGETGADSPSMLAELIEHEHHTLLLAAARAMAAIAARHDSNVRRLARVGLLKVVRRPYPAQVLRPLLECLGQAGTDGGLHDFGQLLGDPHASAELRWLTVEQLAALIERDHVAPAIVALLLRYLDQENADPLSRATAAQALGRSGFALALPVLQRLAGQAGADEHLRSAAVRGLGALMRYGNRETRQQAEHALRTLIMNADQPVRLRAITVTSLPDDYATETRSVLYELLSRQRPEPALAAAALQALGRNHDREALTIILRYCQSEHAVEALAAIEALVTFGDVSTASALVRITLNTGLNQSVRLTAVGALLRLGGVEYLPLLRSYFQDAPLPLRLQALEYLIEVFPTDRYPVLLANDSSTPRMLRLRAIEALSCRDEHFSILIGLVGNVQNENAVRLAALQRLAALADQLEAVGICEQIAGEINTHWQLRRHAIAALLALAQKPPLADAATAALARLSNDPDLATTLRCWAAQSLIDCYRSSQKK
jgi:HEAT repeat protein